MKKGENLSNLKKKSLALEIKEGAAANASSGFGDSFIPIISTYLKANALQIGAISAFPSLLQPISQYFGNKLLETKSRKSILTLFILIQAFLWIPLSILSFYALVHPTNALVWIILPIYALIAIFGGIVYPAWFSSMGDLIPEKFRGKFFGKRDFISIGASILAAIIGALIIEEFKLIGLMFAGFSIVFLFAFFSRFSSFAIIRRMYLPKFKLEKRYEFSLISFIKRYDNYGKFAVYQLFFNFAIMIASPFFGFYLLSELGYTNSLVLYILIMNSSSAFTLMFTPLAGKFSDKYGNYRLLVIANIFFILSPIVWLFSKNVLWLILAPGFVAGIANAAQSMAVSNFTFDSVSKEKRCTCIAYTNILAGVGAFIGSIFGGLLIDNVKSLNLGLDSFLIVFAFAAIIRLMVALIFLPKIKEVKKVKSFSFFPHLHPKTVHHEFSGPGIFVPHSKRTQINKV